MTDKKRGNPHPKKHINPAVRLDDKRLSAVPTAHFTLRLPLPLLERIKQVAEKEGTTMTEVVRIALLDHFESA